MFRYLLLINVYEQFLASLIGARNILIFCLFVAVVFLFVLRLKDKKRMKVYEEKIVVLRKQISEYREQINDNEMLEREKEIYESEIYHRFKYLSYHAATLQPSKKEWEELMALVSLKCPQFCRFLQVEHNLSDVEYRVCLLTRWGFKAAETADLVEISRTSVSIIRKRLLKKIFKEEGNAKKFDELLKAFTRSYKTEISWIMWQKIKN